jgi:hypothetical protein
MAGVAFLLAYREEDLDFLAGLRDDAA